MSCLTNTIHLRGRPSILDEILAVKRREVKEKSFLQPLDEIRSRVIDMPPARGFLAALEARAASGVPAIIAEIKKASPSRGIIREDFDVAWTAGRYEAGGAAALSVLTDASYFHGHDSHLEVAKEASALPVLRKEFILDPWQVYESRLLGADCLLLIVAALEDTKLASLHRLAGEIGLDVLVEVHDEAELERAIRIDARLIGINNRNLHGFETSLEVTRRLAPLARGDRLLVGESGITSSQDLNELREVGVSAFLVGESLIKAEDPAAALTALIGS